VKYRPGSFLVVGVACISTLGFIAFYWTPVIILQLLLLAGLLVVAEYDRRRLTTMMDNLSVQRLLPKMIGRDVPFQSRLSVENRNSEEITGQLRDQVPRAAIPPLEVSTFSIPAKSQWSQEDEFRVPQRGYFSFGPVWIRITGRHRLWDLQRDFTCPGTLEVLPETFASRQTLKKDLGAELRLLERAQRTRQHGPGTEFESLYPFRSGDDPRRIDWRASARQQTLVVRRFQIERHRDVMILLDCGRLMGADVGKGSKLDCAVDGALNLARVVLQSGDRCGIAAYDRKVRGFLPPQGGTTALRVIVKSIYDLQTKWHESDFTRMLSEIQLRQSKRSFFIVVSDLADQETSQRLCSSLALLQRRHLVLLVALRTPLLDQIVQDKTMLDTHDAAQKAVVFRLLRDRRRALHSLSRGGVHVLDVTPEKVSVRMINQFIELRQRNLL